MSVTMIDMFLGVFFQKLLPQFTENDTEEKKETVKYDLFTFRCIYLLAVKRTFYTT